MGLYHLPVDISTGGHFLVKKNIVDNLVRGQHREQMRAIIWKLGQLFWNRCSLVRVFLKNY